MGSGRLRACGERDRPSRASLVNSSLFVARMRSEQNTSFEDFSREEELNISSNRNFGLVFAAFFLVLGAGPLLRGRVARPWALVAAAVFFAISLALPGLLRPLNMLWVKLAMLLQKLTSPVVMGLLFFSTIVPTAFLMRVAKRDPLRLRSDPGASSYWIHRTPPGPEPKSMRDQF